VSPRRALVLCCAPSPAAVCARQNAANKGPERRIPLS
jgi:hypothetical protein